MQSYVVLFRAINVGGRNTLPMAALVELLQGLGCEEVRSYIQSGNVVLHSPLPGPQLQQRISEAVEAAHGFAPGLILLTAEQLRSVAANNPFPEAQGKALHAYFMQQPPPQPQLQRLSAVQGQSERFVLQGTVLYLHAPDGIGRSKLAAQVERAMGVAVTARNWNTVQRLLSLLDG